MKKTIFGLFILFYLPARSQSKDSTLLARAHFNSFKQKLAGKDLAANNQYLAAKRISFPAVMVLYGFISLGNDELQNANKEIREEIRENNDHFKTVIDNYMQFAPAATVYALNAAGIKGRHNFKDRSIILGMSTVLMAGTVFALKGSHTRKGPMAPLTTPFHRDIPRWHLPGLNLCNRNSATILHFFVTAAMQWQRAREHSECLITGTGLPT